ncbi:lamin tail domain-containing protein [Candidatus Poribacteria bacterium]|nr:lamin tail domain-containing protein [Candidatus Poribacteria bacterium]MYC40249.1 lamin tail domain-containing protein [Candidatus Dadabacteria bacterium]
MLSKKMAFSLTSLITIFALAFVVTPVMAGDFSTTVTAMHSTAVENVNDNDVSHADHTQLEALTITLKITFGQVVALGAGEGFARADDIIFEATNMDGGFLSLDPATVFSTAETISDDGKEVTLPMTLPTGTAKLYVQVKAGSVGAASIHVGDDDDANAKGELTIDVLTVNPPGMPDVLKIARVGEPYATVTSETFMVHVLLSEDPKGGLNKDLLEVSEADISSVVKLTSPIATMTVAQIGGLVAADGSAVDGTTVLNTLDTWRDGMLHLYLVTLKTKPGEKTVTIKVKNFSSNENPTPGDSQEMYIRGSDSSLNEGRNILTVKTKQDDPKTPKAAGMKFGLPKGKVIPAGGYLVLAEDKAGSSIHVPPGAIDKTPAPHERNASELIYNVIDDGDLPNLETFLANGGSIGVMGPNALMITEIMWGSDASLDDPGKSQWIELYNAGSEYKTQDGDNTTYLIFYGGGETPAAGLHDLAGTVDAVQGHWSIAGKGQSGASGKRITVKDDKNIDVEATTQAPVISPIISMSRVMTGGTYAKGTLASSWVQSTSPSSNFEANAPGVHIGSPGGMPVTFPEPPAPPPAPAPAAPVAGPMDIKITEIMVDTGSGRLPQWIELTNVSGAAKSLAGWSLMITNAAADADVIGATVSINLSGTLGVGGGEGAGGTMGKSLLLVGGTARSSSNLAGSDRVVDISSQVGQRGRYAFISSIGFMAALIPPQMTGVLAYGDTAGNLGADEAWEIPMDDSGRSSLIRREMDAGMATMGTDANGWVLASSTSLVDGPATWYGSDEDAGTPGYDAGGPLPVELSHFRPARDKATGAVVITWATQSELNNAGFFIKRSQQRDGEFKVINATMIAGAGTTSEKQFYTFTDTTAQPNIVYYYQIEDISLDGNRQTLTRGIRLKGHIGAAGKLTSTWGELKSSNE